MNNKLVETLAKPAIAAAGAAGFSVLLGDADMATELFGYEIPFPAAIAVVVGAASLAAEATKQYVLPRLTKDFLSNSTRYGIVPAWTGLMAIAAGFVLGGFSLPESYMQFFAIGFGGQFVAEMLYSDAKGAIPKFY